jgi:hypothetical protein
MDLDLDINNYNLKDLLQLFKINGSLDKDKLKSAYKATLMTHPDKSSLDKKYFIFFCEAFKKLKYIYDYINNKKERGIHYNPDDINEVINVPKEKLKEFSKRFNELFEKVKINDEEDDNGYGEWLKEKNEENISIHNPRDIHSEIERLKKEKKQLIKYKGIQELNNTSCNYSNLVREKVEDYGSSIFSKLKYEDLKKAHTENVIPVTKEDYHNRKQFNNINELNIYRKQNERLLNKEESLHILEQQKKLEEQNNMYNAYKLMKQMDEIERNNEIWKSKFKQLQNIN